MKQYTFMRHGELSPSDKSKPLNELNFANINAFELSEAGRKHVHEVGQKLIPDDYDVIITATSTRTIQTAEIINQYLHKDLILLPGINPWRADKYSDFVSIDDYWERYFQFTKHNGIATESVRWETFQELADRTKSALDKYKFFSSPLIISHSIIISLYVGVPTKDGIDYCGVYRTDRLEPHEPKFTTFFESD